MARRFLRAMPDDASIGVRDTQRRLRLNARPVALDLGLIGIPRRAEKDHVA